LNRYTYYLTDGIDIGIETLRLKLRQAGHKVSKSDIVLGFLSQSLAWANQSEVDVETVVRRIERGREDAGLTE